MVFSLRQFQSAVKLPGMQPQTPLQNDAPNFSKCHKLSHSKNHDL